MPTRAVGAAATARVWPDNVLRVATLGEQGSDGFHRSWIMLFPEGDFEHEDYGRLHFTRTRLAEIKTHFDDRVRHIDIALDSNHDKDKATGWLERVEMRDGGRDPRDGHAVPPGLWGLVRWTPLGLRYLKDQIYRYFSPEFGPWTDPESGKSYKDVLIGGGLTNRPFLKKMSAIQLSERQAVSTRPWSQVDKACLPDSAFLDPQHRRLPIYEGAGPKDAQGRYTRRGKLNINAVRAALAAVHGARSGKPMEGLPSGAAARLERLMARYGDGGGGTDASATASEGTASEGGLSGMAGSKAGKRTQGGAARGSRAKTSSAKTATSLAEELFERPSVVEAEEQDDEELAFSDGDEGMQFGSGKASGGAKGGRSKKADDSSDDGSDAELDEDGGDDSDAQAYDDGAEGDELDDGADGDEFDEDAGDAEMDDDLEDTPTEGTSGRAGSKRTGGHSQKTMPAMKSKTASEGRRMVGGGGENGRITLAEQLRKLQSEVQTLRERDAEKSFRLYERDVEDQLRRWERGEAGVPGSIALSENGKPAVGRGSRGPIALSRSFKEGYRTLMLKEGFKLSERQRNGVVNLLSIALKDAVVDLSTRGGSFDQESRRTVRASERAGRAAGSDQSDRLEEHARRLAQSEGKVLSELSDAQKFALYERAAEEIEYR